MFKLTPKCQTLDVMSMFKAYIYERSIECNKASVSIITSDYSEVVQLPGASSKKMWVSLYCNSDTIHVNKTDLEGGIGVAQTLITLIT